MKRQQRGFTLIELMIVLAILAIVVSIAYPIYIEQAYKSRRADAKVALTDLAQSLERCRTNTNTYVGCTVPSSSPDGYYDLAASGVAASAYTLTATAKSSGAQAKDAKCKVFTLAHTGAKTATSSDCW